MVGQPRTIHSDAEFRFLEETYGLSQADGFEFPLPGSSILSPPPGKMGVYLRTLDASLRLPLTDFH